MTTLTSANGIQFQVDADDVELIRPHRWYAYVMDGRANRVIKKTYVYTLIYLGIQNGKSKTKTVYLHRLLMNANPGVTVDHINGDPLDNRRQNLRFATRSEQNMNKGVPSNNTSGFKGVSLCKRDQRWQAYIHINGRKKALGYHGTPEAAAKAYDKAAIKLYGEFANLNFPDRK